MRKLVAPFVAVLLLAAPFLSQAVRAQTAPSGTALSADQAREENAYAVGLQAYLWGYPLRE